MARTVCKSHCRRRASRPVIGDDGVLDVHQLDRIGHAARLKRIGLEGFPVATLQKPHDRVQMLPSHEGRSPRPNIRPCWGSIPFADGACVLNDVPHFLAA